jgi:hypothetical protein
LALAKLLLAIERTETPQVQASGLAGEREIKNNLRRVAPQVKTQICINSG